LIPNFLLDTFLIIIEKDEENKNLEELNCKKFSKFLPAALTNRKYLTAAFLKSLSSLPYNPDFDPKSLTPKNPDPETDDLYYL